MPTVVEKDKAPPSMKTGAEEERVGLMDTSRGLVQDHGSREQDRPPRPQQDSGECIHCHSDEMTIHVYEGKNSPVNASRGGALQRKAGRVDVLNGMLVQGDSRAALDRDSWEVNYGRPVPVGNRRDPDYDGKIRV